LEGIMRVAMEGDSPRAYEVVTQMLKTMSEINKDYIDLDNIKKESEKQNIKTTNNNSFFIGSTTDLQDLINPERSKKKALEHIIDVEAENDKKV
jgi:CO/xanthine dehydrogenase FAD-binding subunit